MKFFSCFYWCFFIATFNLLILDYSFSYASYYTIASGNWNNCSVWQNGNIAPLSGSNNNISISGGNTVSLNNNISFNNNCELHIPGNLTINGDLIALNNLIIDVSGTLTITGMMQGKNGASISISGNVSVQGDVSFDNNGTINLNNGTLDIGGNLIGGSNCEITGIGTINIYGTNTLDLTPAEGVDVNPTLPVELIDFSAFVEENNIVLKWSTATETNNDYFSIEKSSDGFLYVEIGVMQGAGNSNSLLNYSFTDILPSSELVLSDAEEGVRYYRLKQTDFNGKCEYFGPISCTYLDEVEGFIFIKTVVSGNNLTVTLKTESGRYAFSLSDISGKTVFSKEMYLNKGSTDVSIPVNSNKKIGLYILSVINFSLNKKYNNKILMN